MKKFFAGLLISAFVFTGINSAIAKEYGTPEEALAHLKKAKAYYDEVGEKRAFEEFNKIDGKFVDRDLYVYCSGPDDNFNVHPITKGLIGLSLYDLTDQDGYNFGKDVISNAKKNNGTAVTYMWYNKEVGKIAEKKVYSMMFGNNVCAVGAYTY